MGFRVDVRDIRITHCATYLIKYTYIREHCVLPLFILLIYNAKKLSQNIVHVCTLRSIM